MYVLAILALIELSVWIIPFAFLFYIQKKIKYRIPFLFLSFAVTFINYYLYSYVRSKLGIYLAKIMNIDLSKLPTTTDTQHLSTFNGYMAILTVILGIIFIASTWIVLLKISKKYFKNNF